MAPDPLSATLAALADPTRRGLLARLALGEASVTELAVPYDMSLAAVSKHLKVLERAGLIARGRQAQWRPCRLDADPMRDSLADWVEHYRRFWEATPGSARRVSHRPAERRSPCRKIDDAVLPEHRELTLVRVYDAPRALVFKAFTDPVHVARWWGPHGFTTPVCEFEARPGGALRIHMLAPPGTCSVHGARRGSGIVSPGAVSSSRSRCWRMTAAPPATWKTR